MSSVIVEADRTPSPAPWGVLVGEEDGLTHIWMITVAGPPGFGVGLHYHGGDEIWRVREGHLRMMVDGIHLDCRAGELVVVPPNVEHGIVVVEEGTLAEVIGEIRMGEWMKVIDPDGSTRHVEVHVPIVPWHRPLPEGMSPTRVEEMQAMSETTKHLI